jgi:hypothetical protein
MLWDKIDTSASNPKPMVLSGIFTNHNLFKRKISVLHSKISI